MFYFQQSLAGEMSRSLFEEKSDLNLLDKILPKQPTVSTTDIL
jgi:hypothetical protein